MNYKNKNNQNKKKNKNKKLKNKIKKMEQIIKMSYFKKIKKTVLLKKRKQFP